MPWCTNAITAATAQSFEVSYDAAQKQIQVLTQDRDHLAKELETLREEQKEQQKEHARVVEKFGKLREALMVERTKVDEAESRAFKAEALAGKGSFNTEESRVLHLQRNPLTEAIRDRYETEIRALHRQLEEATGQRPAGQPHPLDQKSTHRSSINVSSNPSKNKLPCSGKVCTS